MLIDNAINPITGAPAERNVFGKLREPKSRFASMERARNLWRLSLYKHLVPDGRT